MEMKDLMNIVDDINNGKLKISDLYSLHEKGYDIIINDGKATEVIVRKKVVVC